MSKRLVNCLFITGVFVNNDNNTELLSSMDWGDSCCGVSNKSYLVEIVLLLSLSLLLWILV